MRVITLSGIILVIINFCVITNIYAQEDNKNTSIVKTLYFQVEIPDDWVYERSSESSITKILGFGPANTIIGTPAEYYAEVFDPNSTFAGVMFQQDTGYTIKNAPLDAYVKYKIHKQNLMKVISQKDVIVANETARQIELEAIGDNEGLKTTQYYLFHNKEPYSISYGSTSIIYEKYLPDFEKMLKSFKWID